MKHTGDVFAPTSGERIIFVNGAGFADASSPRHHAKNSGFLFEYVLSGEECAESPDRLVKAGIGSLIIVHPSEECVLYRTEGEFSALYFNITGFVLEASAEVLALPRIFCGSAELLDKFLSVCELYGKYSAGDGSSGKSICEIAFSLLLDAAAAEAEGSHIDGKPSAEKIREYLDLCTCGEVSLDAVGRKFGITGMHVIRLFRAKYGVTPMQYLKTARLEKSAKLLTGTRMSIKDISSLLRFSSTQHFTNLFREHFGVSPGKFREKNS